MKRGMIVFCLFTLLPAASDFRPYLQTGPWYPSDPAELQRTLDALFAAAPRPEPGAAAVAVVAPHAGIQYSGRCAAAAYAALSPAQGVRRVILMGSSHRSGFHGAVVAGTSAWATPLGHVAVDLAACRGLAEQALFRSDDRLMLHEHALENQLPFLQKALGSGGWRIVPILFGSLGKEEFALAAKAIAPLLGPETLVVASSDLTHYGEDFHYVPFRKDVKANLEKLDKGFLDPILRLDFERLLAYRDRTGITACGVAPIGVLVRLLEKSGARARLAGYCRSGDLTGDYAASVSYASVVFTAKAAEPAALGRQERKLLLELARSTLRDRFRGRPAPAGLETRLAAHPRLLGESGVFVTLRRRGELRGCIGSLVGVEPLWRGVAANALRAAFEDPRFPPLAENELAAIRIEISVMTPLRPVSGFRAVRLGTDGVVLRDGAAQAVFLPQVAGETGWGLDEFLGRLCLKAGLDRDAYRTSPTLKLAVFQAQVFAEGEDGR